MAYQELIKNFDQIRSYMRDFFVYGFKTRDEYDKKSARSYDNEKRRIQSYLGDYVSFQQTLGGKKVFISMDGREETHNPLYRAFGAKSFTNKDITLYFYLMDIMAEGEWLTLQEILNIMTEEYLSFFEEPISFDESTLRKKCKEYVEMGILDMSKEGKIVKYKRVEDSLVIEQYADAIRFFTEECPIGVIGSFLENESSLDDDVFRFKYHYRMNTLDMEVISDILQGIHEKRRIDIINFGRDLEEKTVQVIPLRLLLSVQGGRSYLMAWDTQKDAPVSFRIDYIESVKLQDPDERFFACLQKFEQMSKHMWGVSIHTKAKLEHVEMDIFVGKEEAFIVRRLEREKRCGLVEKIDEETYRFTADVYNAVEMIPWIRSFFGRIKRIQCTNELVVNRLKYDIVKMAKDYEMIE